MLIGGLLQRTTRTTPLGQVTSLSFGAQSWQALGFGTLIVVSPSQRQAFRKVRYLPYPEQLYLEISRLLRPQEQGGTASQQDGGEELTAQDSS